MDRQAVLLVVDQLQGMLLLLEVLAVILAHIQLAAVAQQARQMLQAELLALMVQKVEAVRVAAVEPVLPQERVALAVMAVHQAAVAAAVVVVLQAALAVLVAVAKYVFIHSIDEKTRYNITPKLYALWSGKLLC